MTQRTRKRPGIAMSAAVALALLAPLAPAGSLAREKLATAAAPRMRFATNVVVDPARFGRNPRMVIDGQHNIYIAAAAGTANATSFLWKSEDGGESFDALRLHLPTDGAGVNAFLPGAGTLDAPVSSRATKTAGGSDATVIVGPPAPGSKQDTVIFVDREGPASFGTATSFDGGNTFTNENVFASGMQPLVGKPWGSTWRDRSGIDHFDLFFDGRAGATLAGGTATLPEYAVIESTDYGKTWTDWRRGVTTHEGRANPGPMLIDPRNGDLLLTWTYDNGSAAGTGFTRCARDSRTCTDTLIASMPGTTTSNTFVGSARDRSGNLYAVWSAIARAPLDPASRSARTYLSSSKDRGATWSKPVLVSGSFPATSMPSVVAGDRGRVAIAFYATMHAGDPNWNAGPWNVVVAQSSDALAKRPVFSIAQAGEHPAHTNPICTTGSDCTTNKDRFGDRNLGDLLSIAMGPRGETLLAWSDTANQLGRDPGKGAPITMFTRQIEGPSLVRSQGTLRAPPASVLEYSGRPNKVNSSAPMNWRADNRNDARVPRHGPGGPGEENTSVDITSAYLEAEGSSAVHAVMQLRDTFNVEVPSPYQDILFMFWWWSNNRVHYAAAEVGPASAGVSGSNHAVSDCYAGEPSSSSALDPVWGIYPATSAPPPAITRIQCSLDLLSGKLTMSIPLSAIGAKSGDRLYSVTASSSLMMLPTIAMDAVTNIPDTIDSVSPFTYVIGQPKLSRRR